MYPVTVQYKSAKVGELKQRTKVSDWLIPVVKETII